MSNGYVDDGYVDDGYVDGPGVAVQVGQLVAAFQMDPPLKIDGAVMAGNVQAKDGAELVIGVGRRVDSSG